MKNLDLLISVMQQAREFLAREDNDFSWSSWRNQEEALTEIDLIIAKLERGIVPEIAILFAPTGRIQEVSIDSGWGNEFFELADRFDKAYVMAKK